MLDTWLFLRVLRLSELQRFCQQMVASLFFFFPWVSLVVFQLIRWKLAVGLRELEQCCYNVVITFLMLKQRCNNYATANCPRRIVTFFISSFVDFNWPLLSEIILIKVLRTRMYILPSVVGFVEYLGGDMFFITIHCMLCKKFSASE